MKGDQFTERDAFYRIHDQVHCTLVRLAKERSLHHVYLIDGGTQAGLSFEMGDCARIGRAFPRNDLDRDALAVFQVSRLINPLGRSNREQLGDPVISEHKVAEATVLEPLRLLIAKNSFRVEELGPSLILFDDNDVFSAAPTSITVGFDGDGRHSEPALVGAEFVESGLELLSRGTQKRFAFSHLTGHVVELTSFAFELFLPGGQLDLTRRQLGGRLS